VEKYKTTRTSGEKVQVKVNKM